MLQTPASFQPGLAPGAAADPLIFLFHRDGLLLAEDGLALPAGLSTDPARTLALGEWNGRPCHAAWTDDQQPPLTGHAFIGLRALFGQVGDELLGIAGRAFQVAEWARTHRFCGACAGPMAQAAGERAMRCAACGFMAYPRISPAMMVLIRKGEQRLLAAHANAPYQRYTALAGFVEAGESIEEAVHREVFEEVGLRVHKLQYFGSQSWPFPHSLMIAFTAEYLDGEIVTDPQEISDARWFGPGDAWPTLSHTVSIASELLAANRP